MWTQVTHGQSVDDIMAKIGRELGIEFKEPSIAMALTYRTGEWLYDEHGSRLDTRLRRWGTGVERIVKGPLYRKETQSEYGERLERGLRVPEGEVRAYHITA